MDESVKCECGNTHFWYFWDFVRCPKCFNEYMKTEDQMVNHTPELWLRRFNKETHNYGNWEHTKK